MPLFFFQISYALVPKIEICLKYFLGKNLKKQPLCDCRKVRWTKPIFQEAACSSITISWLLGIVHTGTTRQQLSIDGRLTFMLNGFNYVAPLHPALYTNTLFYTMEPKPIWSHSTLRNVAVISV